MATKSRWLLGVLLSASFCVLPARAELDSTRLSLPKGPGSIEGLASADFVPNLASGQASYSIPIVVPPAARSFGPNLALSYDSGSGVSELGLGWRVTGVPSVRRRTEDGLPRFDDTDSFEVLGIGVPAELLEVSPGVFRPRYEDGSFLRAERREGEWEVRTKAGQVLSFGGADWTSEEKGKAVAYLLRTARDLRGHEVHYEWRTAGGYPLLDRVVWNAFGPEHENEILFEYETRPDPSRLFSSGIRQTLGERLASISVMHGGELVRRYELSYSEDAHPRLSAVVQVGADGVSRLPAARFRYSEAALAAGGSHAPVVDMVGAPGRSPAEGDASLVDLNGDGLPDLLIGSAGSYRSAINIDGVGWEPGHDWAAADSPSFSLSTSGVQLADFDGDGAADLLASGAGIQTRYLSRPSEMGFGEEVTMAGSLDVGLEDPNVRLADFDGDRRTDVALTTSAGLLVARNQGGLAFEPAAPARAIDPSQTVLFDNVGTELCDINGDRVQDICVLKPASLVYYLGRGHGVFEPAEQAMGVPEFELGDSFSVRDLDGDGWDDLVRVGSIEVAYALAEGEGRFGPVQSLSGVPTKGPSTYATFADMNGSGSVDIVWVEVTGAETASWRYLELFPEGRAGLLTEIENGLGKRQTIEYASAASFAAAARQGDRSWTSRLNIALPVVARVTVESGLGDPDLVQEYRYWDGVYDPAERTFAAFSRGETRAIGDESTPTLVTERHFESGLSRRVLRGVVLLEEQRNLEGAVFSRQSHEYRDRTLDSSLDGRMVEYGYRSAVLTEVIEGVEEASVVTLAELEQDEFGNVVLERNWGVIDGDDYLVQADEAITIRTFANDADEWVLGYPATETLQSGAGEMVAGARKYYDGEPFEGLALGKATRGEVTREEAWVGPRDGDFELVVATRYDAHGMPVETRDARGGGRFFSWDGAHTTLLSEGVKLDASDEADEVRLVERARFDGRFGTLLEVSDFSGAVTRYDYDTFGRLTAVIQPGDSEALPTVRHRYEEGAPLSRIVTEARLASGDAAVELREDVFDGLGRKRASFVLDAELWLLAGVNLFDARGLARRTLLPRWVSEVDRESPPLQEEGDGYVTWRDATGREVRTRSAEGIVTRTSYAPLRTLHWDGGQADDSSPYEHTPVVSIRDGLGRTIGHERALYGELLRASYGYDAAGHLVSRLDPEGNLQRFGYDGRGRRVWVDDPDQGEHHFAYDGAGNLLWHEHPDAQKTTFSYDLADRLLSEDWDGDGNPEIVQEYDAGPSEHVGKLVRVIEPSGFIEHTYDERGRVTETLYHIEGQDYRVGSRFDAQGREIAHVYPDGSHIDIRRNARGQLSGYGQLLRLEYSAQGAETVRKFSSGTTLHSQHDKDNRRRGFEFRDADGEAVEHLTWSYDQGGNLLSVVDEREDVSEERDRSEIYGYDNLYRLTSVTGNWGSTEWSYSSSGNLLGRTSTLEAQRAPQVDYGRLPHGPTAVGNRNIDYDQRGRMTSDGVRKYTWDGASQLVRVSSGAASVESIYGQDGVRRVKRETTESGARSTTHLIDAWSEVKDGQLIRYVVHAGERVVRLAPGPREPEDDPQASAGLVRGSSRTGWGACLVGLLGLLVLAFRSLRRMMGPLAVRRAVATLLLALFVVGPLSGCSRVADAADGEPIEALVPGDVLLVTDQVGSLLGEFDEQGKRRTEVGLAPYGFARHDESSETYKYAGTPRDGAVGLDHMGSRFYAPDLGIWTSADPVSLSEPQRQVTAEFAAAHSYAYANLRPVIAADRDGRFAHFLVGAGIGFLAGGAVEIARQYVQQGSIQDWGRVGVAAAGGAVGGILIAAVPATSLLGAAAVGGTSTVAAGLTERLIESGGKSAGTLQDVVVDFGSGAAGGVVAKGGTAAVKGIGSKFQPKAPVASRVAGEPAASGASGGRVFWSGGEASKNAAARYAERTGGETLEMTSVGRALEAMPGVESRPLWAPASKEFAEGASGQVDVFLGHWTPISIWHTVERDAVSSNPGVTGIRIHLTVVQ